MIGSIRPQRKRSASGCSNRLSAMADRSKSMPSSRFPFDLPPEPVRMTPQYLLIDADDTLWENNIYFERAFDEFVAFLDHSSTVAARSARGAR